MSKILSPSEINFLIETGDGDNIEPDTSLLNDLSRQFIEKKTIPKLQVSEKNGSWFALNNTSLSVVKELERQGKCLSVQVEIVPLSKVPLSLQKGMLTASGQSGKMENETMFSECCSTNSNEQDVHKESKGERRGFRRLQIEENFGIDLDENTGKYGTSDSYDYGDDTGESTSTDASDYDQDYDESEGDESLVCNVCDKAFSNGRKLGRHQLLKKHFCCSVCDALFPTLMVLQIHKKTLEHWTDDEVAENEAANVFTDQNELDHDHQDSNTMTNRQPYEEIERLL